MKAAVMSSAQEQRKIEVEDATSLGLVARAYKSRRSHCTQVHHLTSSSSKKEIETQIDFNHTGYTLPLSVYLADYEVAIH